MATSDRFEKLETLYQAISRLDLTISVEETNKLENVLDVVKDISKDDFPKEYQDAMISNIRGALVKLYTDEMSLLSSRLGIQIPVLNSPGQIPSLPVSPSPIYIGDPEPRTAPMIGDVPSMTPIVTCSDTTSKD